MTGTRWAAVLLAAAVGTTALAGCGGPPDAAGIWEGDLDVPDEGRATMTLDLQQGEEGRLSGTMRVLEEGDSPDDVASSPISFGTVNDDGSFQVVVQNANVSGEVSGDEMDASFELGGPALPYRAERITEEEYRSRLEERHQAYERRVAEEQAAQERRDEASARYSELDASASEEASSAERRLASLTDPAGEGPEERLQDALGPEDTESESFACATGGVSCEVEDLEGRLEGDREDAEEDASDEYAPSACDVVDFDYYEEYGGLSAEGGADYARLRDELQAAAEGLGAEAESALEAAREAEAARRDYEEVSGYSASLTYSVEEVEAMAADAAEAEQSTAEAIGAAEERYAGYEGRAAAVVQEGLALKQQAGC